MTVYRRAGADDAVALRDVEQAAGLAAHRHIFPPERYPYPADDVLARWHLTLGEPGVVVELVQRGGDLAGLVAYDRSGTLRHLAVVPELWGQGVATDAVTRAAAWMRAQGLEVGRLWCLVENHRARGLYERLGWAATGATQAAPWPPYPLEMEYALLL
jgi:RimJ/RimL family protein N-acetyltransferase